MGEKHYFKRDGNGGWNISNSVAFVSLMFMILSLLLPTAFAYGILNNKVENNKEKIVESLTIHTGIQETIDDLDTEVALCKTNNEVTSTKLEVIKDDIQEIKETLKEIRDDLKEVQK